MTLPFGKDLNTDLARKQRMPRGIQEFDWKERARFSSYLWNSYVARIRKGFFWSPEGLHYQVTGRQEDEIGPT